MARRLADATDGVSGRDECVPVAPKRGETDYSMRHSSLSSIKHRAYLQWMKRNLSKTLSFLVLHLLVGFTVAYLFTGSVMVAGGIALVEPLVNAVVFFFHERAWEQKERPALLDVMLHRHGAEERSVPG